MATVTPTQSNLNLSDDSFALTWAITTANANGAPLQRHTWNDRSWMATGTWGGATLTLEGSMDGSTWVALKDVNGAAATLTTDGAIHVQNCPLYMRPNLTVVGVGAAITVTCLARRTYSPRD